MKIYLDTPHEIEYIKRMYTIENLTFLFSIDLNRKVPGQYEIEGCYNPLLAQGRLLTYLYSKFKMLNAYNRNLSIKEFIKKEVNECPILKLK